MLNVTWEEYLADVETLTENVLLRYHCDILVAVCRGGVIPSLILSHKLSKPFVMWQASTRDGFRDFDDLNVEVLKLLEGKQVIIVDDIIDSGRTMKNVVEELYASELVAIATVYKAASYIHKVFPPLLYARETTDWVHFPYEWEEEHV